jgi:putative phosphoesterase
MKIGIFSDTHDDREAVLRAVDLFNSRRVDKVIHAGDFATAATVGILSGLDAPFGAVHGNCDIGLMRPGVWWDGGEIHRSPWRTSLGGKRTVVVHEHHSVEKLAGGGKFDLVIYGHLHVPDVRTVGETLVVNPGKTARQRQGRSTVAFLDTENMHVQIVDLFR